MGLEGVDPRPPGGRTYPGAPVRAWLDEMSHRKIEALDFRDTPMMQVSREVSSAGWSADYARYVRTATTRAGTRRPHGSFTSARDLNDHPRKPSDTMKPSEKFAELVAPTRETALV